MNRVHQRPTFQDVLKAKAVIAGYLPRTPLYRYSSLCQLLGCEVYVKHENHQPVGAFKVRGGINLVSQLSDDERRRGVIAASTGNHGQSVAYAARLFGVEATIVVPEGANPGKVEAMRGLGAHIIFHGQDFDQAREHCEALVAERGYRYIHSGNEPLLIAGVTTETLEMLEDQPDIEVIIVPIGGGSGAAGASSRPKPSTRPSRSSACRRRRLQRPIARGRSGGWWKIRWRRRPRGWPRVPPSPCRRASSGSCWTISSW